LTPPIPSAIINAMDVHDFPTIYSVLKQNGVVDEPPDIAPGDTAALEALLPDRWLATHPEHRLEQRWPRA
jgi:hypothetical protein